MAGTQYKNEFWGSLDSLLEACAALTIRGPRGSQISRPMCLYTSLVSISNTVGRARRPQTHHVVEIDLGFWSAAAAMGMYCPPCWRYDGWGQNPGRKHAKQVHYQQNHDFSPDLHRPGWSKPASTNPGICISHSSFPVCLVVTAPQSLWHQPAQPRGLVGNSSSLKKSWHFLDKHT